MSHPPINKFAKGYHTANPAEKSRKISPRIFLNDKVNMETP